MKPIHTILISFVVTALIVGGGTYYFINAKATKDKNNLQSQITELNRRLADARIATTIVGTPTSTTSPTSPTNTSTATSFKSLTWIPYSIADPVKTNSDMKLNVQYPANCTIINYAPSDPMEHASPDQPTEIDCPTTGGKMVLQFTAPFTEKDPRDASKLVNGFSAGGGDNISNTKLTTKYGTYTKSISSSIKYPSGNSRIDYFFNGLTDPDTRAMLQAVGYVPVNTGNSQITILDNILKSLTCNGTACPKTN